MTWTFAALCPLPRAEYKQKLFLFKKYCTPLTRFCQVLQIASLSKHNQYLWLGQKTNLSQGLLHIGYQIRPSRNDGDGGVWPVLGQGLLDALLYRGHRSDQALGHFLRRHALLVD